MKVFIPVFTFSQLLSHFHESVVEGGVVVAVTRLGVSTGSARSEDSITT